MFTVIFRPHQKGQYLIISLNHFLPSPLLDPPFSTRHTTVMWSNNKNKLPTCYTVHYNISKKQWKLRDVILQIMAHDATGKGETVAVHHESMKGALSYSSIVLTLALDEDERSVSCPRKRVPNTHWIGGWWASELVCTLFRKISSACSNRIPDCQVYRLITIPTLSGCNNRWP